ncbi:hypothetical protein HDU82_009272 [Entophlyctis luteolus]|nr:hypothetical protein HDU82_009272 [Entophlyctis luteolus]
MSRRSVHSAGNTYSKAVFVLRAMQTLWSDGVDPFTRKALNPASETCNNQLAKPQPHTPPPALLHNVNTPPASPMHLDSWDAPLVPAPTAQQKRPALLHENSSLVAQVARLVSPPALTFPIVALALLLVSRLRQQNLREPPRTGAEGHVLSTAFLVALKALDDWRIYSSAWVPYVGGGMTLKTMNAMEMEFLRKIRWHVYVDADEYGFFVMFLRGGGGAYGADVAYPLIPSPSMVVSVNQSPPTASAAVSTAAKRRSMASSVTSTAAAAAAAAKQQQLRKQLQQRTSAAYLHPKFDQAMPVALSNHLPAAAPNPVKLSNPPSRHSIM